MDIFPLIGRAIRVIPVERIFFPPRNPQAELAKFLEAERLPEKPSEDGAKPQKPPEDGTPPPLPAPTPAKSQLTPEETLAYQNREIARELWMLEKHLAQGCRIPDNSGTPIPCDCCEKGGFIAALALEAIPIAERVSLPSEDYQAVVAWAEALGPKVTVDAIVSGVYDYRALSGEASALRKKLMGTLALGALKSSISIPGNPGKVPGNPGELVKLEEEIHQYLLGQQRPQESMSETIARLTKGEVVVEENLLSSAQHQVLALAAEGLTNKEIADRLVIEPGTVRVHLRDIRRQIGVLTTEEARAAFGKPTLRERVPISVLRKPLPEEVPKEALRLERRAQESLEILVDEVEGHPSTETVGKLEEKLSALAGEIQASLELAPKGGVNAVRLAILRGRLATINEDIAPVRGALALMEQETLPLRKEVAERGLEAAIRILRETLTAIPWAESIPRAADGGLTKGVLTKPVFP